MLYNVAKVRLRYIVPVTYEGQYKDIVETIENMKIEGKRKWLRLTKEAYGFQNELYEHIHSETLFENDSSNDLLDDAKIGCQWVHYKGDYFKQKDGKVLQTFRFYNGGLKEINIEEDKFITLKIKNAGLIIYRNNLGLLWYEILIDDTKELDSENLLKVLSYLKKINVDDKGCLWTDAKRVNGEKDFGIELKIGKNKDVEVLMQPFHLGEWVRKEYTGINIEFLSKQKSSYGTTVKRSLKAAETLPNIKVYNVLDKDRFEKYDVPSHAISFCYVVFEHKDDAVRMLDNMDMADLAYNVANGHKNSHSFNEININIMKFPSKEMVWYASKEGLAFLVWPNKNSIQNFKENVFERTKKAYFTLFTKAIYQSCSLMQYSNQIAKQIAVSDENSLKGDITKLFTNINVFLSKNIQTSVSNTYYQNEFYVYLVNSLRINENVKSITIGLDALNSIKQEQDRQEFEKAEKARDNKIQTAIGLFAILGVFSALADGFDFIAKFDIHGDWYNLSEDTKSWEMLGIAFVLLIVIAPIWYTLVAIKDAFYSKK